MFFSWMELKSRLSITSVHRDAVVVRKKDAHWGEVPVAFVVKADDSLSAQDVVAICRGKVANYKLPKEVYFIAESDMPRSETDKVKRFDLEKRLSADADSSASP